MDAEVVRRLDHLEQIIANLTTTVDFHAQIAREEALERRDAAIEHAEELFKTTKTRLTEMDASLSRKMGKVSKKVTTIQKIITRWDLEITPTSGKSLDHLTECQTEQGPQQPTPAPSASVNTQSTQGAFTDDREVQADHLVLDQEVGTPMTMTTPRLHSAVNWDSALPNSEVETNPLGLFFNDNTAELAKASFSQPTQGNPDELASNPTQESPMGPDAEDPPQQGINPADLHPATWFDLHREPSPLSTLSDNSASEIDGDQGASTADRKDKVLGKRKTRKRDESNRLKKNSKTKKSSSVTAAPKLENEVTHSFGKSSILLKPYPSFEGWPAKSKSRPTKREKRFWVRCERCEYWYHAVCIGWVETEPPQEVNGRWHCPPCQRLPKDEACPRNRGIMTCARTDCASTTEAKNETTEEYEMEYLVGRRPNGNTRYFKYLVKWFGYDLLSCTWEAQSKFPQFMIDEFNAKAKKQGLIEKGIIELLPEASRLEWV